jgi:hypothetical protein
VVCYRAGANTGRGARADTLKTKCPICGHENEAYASECTKCFVNLKWALDNIASTGREEETRAEKPELIKKELIIEMKGAIVAFGIIVGAIVGPYVGYGSVLLVCSKSETSCPTFLVLCLPLFL